MIPSESRGQNHGEASNRRNVHAAARPGPGVAIHASKRPAQSRGADGRTTRGTGRAARLRLGDRHLEDRAQTAAAPFDGLRRMGRISGNRSEEHTSELQSLMRISYAVFCLKKKKRQLTHEHTDK